MNRLDDVEFVVSLLQASASEDNGGLSFAHRAHRKGLLYCPRCGGDRRMNVKAHDWPEGQTGQTIIAVKEAIRDLRMLPMLFTYQCVQCLGDFTSVLYPAPGGRTALVVLSATSGGLSTPHTPEAVAYYLDQAHRAHTIGANSAAIAMYRSALEQLLHEQGFTARMVGPKIAALQEAISAGTAPRWTQDLDAPFLSVLNRLGTTAVHANDGDISRQDAFDSALLLQVQETFVELLDLVYEQPKRRAARRAALEAAANPPAPRPQDSSKPRN